MNALMRPDFRPKFNPGEAPVGSITWFVGTQERFSQLTDSGNWIVCGGGSTVIDPDGEGRGLFETLGGQHLRGYLAGESPSSVLEKVSPLLTHTHSYEVLDGFRGFSVSNRLRQMNGSSAGWRRGALKGGEHLLMTLPELNSELAGLQAAGPLG